MGCIFSCSKQSSRRVNNTADPINSSRSTAEILPPGEEHDPAIGADSGAPNKESSKSPRFWKSPLRVLSAGPDHPPASPSSLLRWKTKTPSSSGTEIVNYSSDKISVREKHRDVWGRELYSIPPGESITVQPQLMAGTFVWMEIVWGDKQHRAKPPICIDSDDLPLFQRFVIIGHGARLILEKIPADR